MRRLSKKRLAEFTGHRTSIESARERLESLINVYNEHCETVFAPVEEAASALDGFTTEFNAWAEEIHAEMDEYHGERSDRWQESAAGGEYECWQDAWADVLDELDLEKPEPLEMPEVSVPCEDEYPPEPGLG